MILNTIRAHIYQLGKAGRTVTKIRAGTATFYEIKAIASAPHLVVKDGGELELYGYPFERDTKLQPDRYELDVSVTP